MSAAMDGARISLLDGGHDDPGEHGAAWRARVEAARAAGGRVVTTNGCFDVLHPGHVTLLEQARAQGDLLVVGLNSDASVSRLKGEGRPVVPEMARARVLAGLRAVDHVVIFDDDTPVRFLAAARPHVHCKGGDYRADALPEAAVVRERGGEIRILPLVEGWSTTSLIARGAAAPPAADRIVLDEMLRAGRVVEETAHAISSAVQREAERIAETIAAGGRILICGNGGSAADAQHFAAELVGRFRIERPAWPAIALTADSALVTALANDYGWERVFVRQVEALGRPGDMLFAISTSGRSANVLAAVEAARAGGLRTTGLTGGPGSPLGAAVEHALAVPSGETPMIQQAHRAVIHAICALVEHLLTSPARG